MSLTYGLKNANDLFKKMLRDSEAIKKEVSSNNFFNFVVTAYHLCEWVEKDPSYSKDAKRQIHSLREQPQFKICRDIANASKHFKSKEITAKEASSEKGFGLGRFGHGGYGVGEESIRIELCDGTEYDALELCNKIESMWSDFFKNYMKAE